MTPKSWFFRRKPSSALSFSKSTILPGVHYQFNTESTYGSKQHFFHFLMGYLLPALHQYLSGKQDHRMILSSCGPVMDQVTHDLLGHLAIPYQISNPANVGPESDARQLVPRWDLYMLQAYTSHPDNQFIPHVRAWRKNQHLAAVWDAPTFRTDFLKEVAELRNFLFRHIDPKSNTPLKPGSVLVIDRAPEPDFYQKGGPAEIPTYGRGRRALQAIPKVLATIPSDYPVSFANYRATKRSIVEQIADFRSAGGFVGIRGAEFAHMMWLPAGTKVLMYRPKTMNTPPVQRNLADLLGLPFHEVVTSNNYPPVSREDLLAVFCP